jgi:TetR/AcrR family transcriptional regulator, regulator of cefoperazone and chloramphenicol sensitivity
MNELTYGMSRTASKKTAGDAKQRLIEAGLEIFGTFNLEGATTRQLASRAGVNQAAIPYYFGGKEELYLAVVQHMVDLRTRELRPAILQMRELVQKQNLTPAEAFEMLKAIFGQFLEKMLSGGIDTAWARIIIREQMQPTKAFDVLYQHWMRFVHETITGLLAVILRKKPTDQQVILRAHALLGQMLIFIAGRQTILRRVSWETYDEQSVKAVRQALFDQMDLMLKPLVQTAAKGSK